MLVDKPQEGQRVLPAPQQSATPNARAQAQASADCPAQALACFSLGLQPGPSPVSLSCGSSVETERQSELVADYKLVAQGWPAGQSCASRCDRGVAWPALGVFSGRASVQVAAHHPLAAAAEWGGGHEDPCVCVLTSKTSLPEYKYLYRYLP